MTAQKIDHFSFAVTTHGKWTCSDVTCESGHGFAKSIGCQTPSLSSASHELKSQPKKLLMVSVVSSSRRIESASMKSRSSW